MFVLKKSDAVLSGGSLSKDVLRNLRLSSTLLELTLYDFQVESSTPGGEIAQAFSDNPLLPGVTIVEGDRFVGMMSRRQFFEHLSRPYGLELFVRRPIKALYALTETEILIFPGETLIVMAARRSLQRSPEFLDEPIVVRVAPHVYKLLDSHQLLVAQSQIHELTTQLNKLILNSAGEGIFGLNRDGRTTFVNPAGAQMLGYDVGELIGIPMEKFWSSPPGETCSPDAENPFDRVLESGGIYHVSDTVFWRSDGMSFPVEYAIAPLQDSGETIGAVVTFKDITERKKAEAEVRNLNETLARYTVQLKATNKELEAFSYSVSHDLRAPLRTIDGFAQALLEDYSDGLDELGQHYLKRMRVATQRMGQLIADLLRLSRLNRTQMQRESVNLSQMAQAIAKDLQQMEPRRSVEFAIAPTAIAQGDRRLIRVLLENLLGNAWKFTRKVPQAHIELGVTDRCALIAQGYDKFSTRNTEVPPHQPVYFVRDNGAGFDMTYAEKLFAPFQRLHSSSEFEGTGIGLATVRRIINRHGGQVWAMGEVNRGAAFYFTLHR